MDSPDKKARELRHKEQELRKREQEIRLRELEAEIDRSVPEHRTSKYEEPDSQVKGKLKQWRRKIIAVAQFTGIVIATVVAVRIASWLATAVIVGGIAWIAYKIFFAKDRS
jgi:anti-sigma-K factor RskA